MNENHQRHLLTTLRHIDNLLSEAEYIVASAGSGSPFAEYTQDSTPVQRKVLHDHIERVRKAMADGMADLRLPRPPPICGASWGASGRLTFTQIAVAEIEPKRMKGYGTLTEDDVNAINEVVAELNGVLQRLIGYWNQGGGQDLQARLARLAETTGELGLLRELERVITAHGLVEFREPLGNLVERLESNSFEIGVFGRVSSGKSSLLNFVLETALLPVGVTPVTAFPTSVMYGTVPQARIEFADARPEVIEVSRLKEFVSEQENPGNAKHVARIRAELPSAPLREGVAFVDTPGLGSLATSGGEETLAYLPRCDMGIVLVDAGTALTHEDVAIVQALYMAGARAMVLVSKADLLSPEDLRQTVDYVEKQLETQASIKLRVFPVSVFGERACLCEEWLRIELMPLVDSHREQAQIALKRKVGALREAVIAVLEARRGRPAGANGSNQQEAINALRKAEVYFEEAARQSEPILDGLDSCATMLEQIADDLADTWVSGERADGNGLIAEGLGQALNKRVIALAEILSRTKQSLAQSLNIAHKAATGEDSTSESLPVLNGAPIPDIKVLAACYSVDPPPFYSRFAKALVRAHYRQQLQTKLRAPVSDFWNGYRRQLQNWFGDSLSDLREGFSVRSGFYRPQLEGRALAQKGTLTEAHLEADVNALKGF